MMKEFKGSKKQRGILSMMAGSTTNITSKGSEPGDPGDPDITSYSFTKNGSHAISGNNHNTPYFNLAGTRVYFNRTTSVETWQYSMSTPGDMSTIAFELTHLWGTTQFQRAISFNPDRTKFYKIRRASPSGDSFISADPFSADEAGEVAGGNPYTLTGVSALAGIGTPTTPIAFCVAANNLDMFVMSADVLDRAIYHYQMSIAGDAGTATTQGQALDVSSEFDTNLFSIVYTPDGSKLFVVGTDSGAVIIAQYDMSTAYDVNTAVYSGKQITVSPANTILLGLFVWDNPSGGFQFNLTYPTGGNNNGFNWSFDQYDTVPPPPTVEIDDFSVSQSQDMSGTTNRPGVIWVSQDGGKLVISDQEEVSPDQWRQFSMTVANDLTTLTGVESTRSFGTPDRIGGVFVREDGLRMFGTVFQGSQFGVTRNTANADFSPPFDISSVTQEDAFNAGFTPISVFFSSDGLKFWILDIGIDTVKEYSMSTAWDPATATQINTFGYGGQIENGRGIAFSSDGTRMFLSDVRNNINEIGNIYQYNLTAGFDISTASFSGKSISALDVGVTGLYMVDDNKLYAAYNGINIGTLQGVKKFVS